MVLQSTNKRFIRPFDKPSFEHTQRYGLIKGHQLSSRLIGYWPLNEGSGKTVFDLSGNGCTGTFVADTSWIAGKFGCALDFDAVGDYVQIAAGGFPNIPADGSFTICGWANLRNSPGGNYESIFGLGDSGDNPTIALCVTVERNLSGFLETDTSDQIQFTVDGTKLGIGAWTFVALVIDRGNDQAIRYVNGLQTGTVDDISAQTGSISHLNNVVIGKMGRIGETANIYWNGQLDNVSAFNCALSAYEVALIYSNPFCMLERGIFAPGLVPEAVAPKPLYAPDLFKFGYRYVPGEIKVVERAAPDIFKMLSGFVPEAIPVTARSTCVIHGWTEVA